MTTCLNGYGGGRSTTGAAGIPRLDCTGLTRSTPTREVYVRRATAVRSTPGDVGSAEAALEVLDAAVDEAVATRPGPAEEDDGETTLGQTLTGNSAGDGLLQGIFPLAVSQSFQITGELWDAFLRAVRLSAREALAIMGTLF